VWCDDLAKTVSIPTRQIRRRYAAKRRARVDMVASKTAIAALLASRRMGIGKFR
jgi:hypothetical protein